MKEVELKNHTFNSQEDTKWVSENDLNILSRDIIENEANLQTAQRGRRWGGRERRSEMGSESNKDAFDEEIYCHLSSLIFLFFISFLV